MSMTTYARDDRPVREPEDPRRAAMARRTLTRWAVRLALREWKQRILIVLLIAVASAATLLGIAVASATPGTPNAGTFGTASTLVELPGNTPHLPSVIAKIEKAYGTASVVYDEPIATGQAGGADLRAQDPSAPYTQVLLALDSGRYPSGPGRWRSRPGSPSFTACASARPGTSPPGQAPRPAAPSPSPASSRTRPTCSTSSPSSPPASSPARTRCGSSSASPWTPPPRPRQATSYRRARSSARPCRKTPSSPRRPSSSSSPCSAWSSSASSPRPRSPSWRSAGSAPSACSPRSARPRPTSGSC